MHVGFTKRQKIGESFDYLGGYVQAGYFVTDRLQPALRYDFFDRNGLDKGGLLNMPAVGLNYYFKGVNLKLQGMYRYMGRTAIRRSSTATTMISASPLTTQPSKSNILSNADVTLYKYKLCSAARHFGSRAGRMRRGQDLARRQGGGGVRHDGDGKRLFP